MIDSCLASSACDAVTACSACPLQALPLVLFYEMNTYCSIQDLLGALARCSSILKTRVLTYLKQVFPASCNKKKLSERKTNLLFFTQLLKHFLYGDKLLYFNYRLTETKPFYIQLFTQLESLMNEKCYFKRNSQRKEWDSVGRVIGYQIFMLGTKHGDRQVTRIKNDAKGNPQLCCQNLQNREDENLIRNFQWSKLSVLAGLLSFLTNSTTTMKNLEIGLDLNLDIDHGHLQRKLDDCVFRMDNPDKDCVVQLGEEVLPVQYGYCAGHAKKEFFVYWALPMLLPLRRLWNKKKRRL